MNHHRHHVVAQALLIGAALSGLYGCGRSNPMGQVRGQVTFADGKMPEAGVRVVRLECAADTDAAVRKGATGIVKDDGTFEVYTRRPGDGVHYGKYDVTILFCRSTTDQRPLIPAEYTMSATSPFHVVVDGDEEFKFDVKLRTVAKNTE
jgi:hypothetical protein